MTDRTEKSPKKGLKKWIVLAVLAIMVISTMSIAVSDGPQHQELLAIGTAGTLIPNGVNNTLNITLSDLTYITEPPQFAVYQGNYNTSNSQFATSTGSTGFVNSTYLIENSSTLSQVNTLQYNVTADKGNISYFFTEARLAYNGTGANNYIVSGSSLITTSVSGTTTTITTSAVSASSSLIYVSLGSTPTLNYLEANATATQTTSQVFTSVSGGNLVLNPLNFYLVAIYITNKSIDATIMNTANGAILGTSDITVGQAHTTATYVPDISTSFYKDANYTSFQYTAPSTGTATSIGFEQEGFIVDWMYVATYNKYNYSLVQTNSVDSNAPMFIGASSDFNILLSSVSPFDPSAVANETYTVGPNATSLHENTGIGGKSFTNVTSSNSTSTISAINLNTSAVKNATSYSKNQTMNSTAGFQTIATNAQNNTEITANIHIAVFNASGIQSAVMKYLKNYASNHVALTTGIAVNASDITIMGYSIGSIQLDTSLSASDASAVRNYFDNALPALMEEDNMSLVDANTSAIVAGAFAGFFYYDGGAMAPLIQGNEIIDPINGHRFSSLADAGFASGAYISGGAIIVPQLQIVGWAEGTPIFADSGFSFGSIFSGLSSAGSSVEHWLGNGASSISNGIGTATKSATNYVTKAIFPPAVQDVAKVASQKFTDFQNGVAKIANDVVPTLGAVTGTISKDIHGAVGPIAGAVNDVSTTLGSVKQGVVTAVASGYSGLKTDVTKLGNDTSSSLGTIENVLGKDVSQSQAVLSNVYTAMANLPGEAGNDFKSLETGMVNASKISFSDLMNTAGNVFKTVDGKIQAIQSTFGGISNDITSGISGLAKGAKADFSVISAFGAKLGYILEIVGITIAVVAIIGIILLIYFKRPGVHIPGETNI